MSASSQGSKAILRFVGEIARDGGEATEEFEEGCVGSNCGKD